MTATAGRRGAARVTREDLLRALRGGAPLNLDASTGRWYLRGRFVHRSACLELERDGLIQQAHTPPSRFELTAKGRRA